MVYCQVNWFHRIKSWIVEIAAEVCERVDAENASVRLAAEYSAACGVR